MVISTPEDNASIPGQLKNALDWVVMEQNPCIVKLANTWVIMNRGVGPTHDKPGIEVRAVIGKTLLVVR